MDITSFKVLTYGGICDLQILVIKFIIGWQLLLPAGANNVCHFYVLLRVAFALEEILTFLLVVLIPTC